MTELDISVQEIENNMHFQLDNLFLTNNQIMTLEKYKIDYNNCSSMSELIFEIEEYLNDEPTGDCKDLEMVSFEISEMNYYMNTNK